MSSQVFVHKDLFIYYPMATSKSKKADQLEALTSKFKEAQGVSFIRFEGITVEEAQTMRRELRAEGMSYTVIKKTLMELAAKNAGLPEVDANQLDGSVAVIVSSTDEIAPAAAIKKYKTQFADPETKESRVDFAGAIFEGKFLDAAATAVIANTPSREESLGKIVGMLRSGPQKLHGVFNSGFQKLYNVMQNAEKFAA